MVDFIKDIYERNNFQNAIAGNSGEVLVYVRKEYYGNDVIVTLNDRALGNITSNVISKLESELSKLFMTARLMQPDREFNLIYVVITNGAFNPSNVFLNGEKYFVVDLNRKELRVYEEYPPVFDFVRRDLEDYLSGKDLINHYGNEEYDVDQYVVDQYGNRVVPNKYSRNGQRNSGEKSPVKAITKNYKVTALLVLANVICFLVMSFQIAATGNEAIYEYGACNWDRVINYHEYYRLITAMFIHAGAEHIFNNMFLLIIMGVYLEKIVGDLSYTIIYFGSGIIAGLSSVLYNMHIGEYTYSVGASGAVFGVVGAFLYLLVRYKGRIQGIGLRQLIILIAVNIYSGFVNQGIDNAAHIGGVIGGFVVCAIVWELYAKKKYGWK
ncbi:MAG: rhomboid family intramembrane serine protease [Lachnospiraceae bacterium]|nr:rhomboid family intramembrane serine protease [Lachnospiraceae bacterium]